MNRFRLSLEAVAFGTSEEEEEDLLMLVKGLESAFGVVARGIPGCALGDLLCDMPAGLIDLWLLEVSLPFHTFAASFLKVEDQV